MKELDIVGEDGLLSFRNLAGHKTSDFKRYLTRLGSEVLFSEQRLTVDSVLMRMNRGHVEIVFKTCEEE